MYVLQNNAVYLRTDDGIDLLYIPESISYDILDYLHNKTLHQGVEKLKAAIFSSKIFLKNRTSLTEQICRNCLFCQMANPNKYKRPPQVEFRIRPSFSPWKEVSINLIDISYGNQSTFFLSFLDKFSHFLDGEICTNKSAETVIPALLILITKYNLEMSSSITSDNGKEFLNKIMASCCARLGIYHTRISAWNSRANSVERIHKELRRILLALDTNSVNYKWKIKIAVNHYNNTPQEKLGFLAPNQIILGMEPKDFFNCTA